MIYFKWYCIAIIGLLIVNMIVDLFRVASSKKWYSYIEEKLKTAYLHPLDKEVICFGEDGVITKTTGILNCWDIENVGPVLRQTKLNRLIEQKYKQLLQGSEERIVERQSQQIKIYF